MYEVVSNWIATANPLSEEDEEERTCQQDREKISEGESHLNKKLANGIETEEALPAR